MAININGQVLRNVPEQVSKNVEDIEDLQDRVTDLENGIIGGDLNVGGNLSVTGNSYFADISATSASFTSTLTAPYANINGNCNVYGTLWCGNNLNVVGNISASSFTGRTKLETIYDAGNHARFIEGTLEELPQTGLTISYSKWSLSGTHLMVVVAGSVQNGSSLTSGIAQGTIPSWIYDKLVDLYYNKILVASVSFYDSNGLTQTNNFTLAKSGGNLRVEIQGTFTATADRVFRVQFDALIDNPA